MAHDQGCLRFFAYMDFFSTSMLGLVTNSNFKDFYMMYFSGYTIPQTLSNLLTKN